MVEFSPYAYEFHEDPYPLYQRLRDEAPVYHNVDGDFWALSRHADVLAAFKDVKRFSNIHGVSIDPAARGAAARIGTSFLAMDPPEHTRFRSLVARSFTPRRVAALETRIREIAARHLDALVGAGDFDAITDFFFKALSNARVVACNSPPRPPYSLCATSEKSPASKAASSSAILLLTRSWKRSISE